MSNHIQPRIAIVGGGPSGLVLLLSLFRRGISATLYERDADSNGRARLGGMLDLEWSTGQRALRENGLEEAFKKYSRRDAQEARICGKDGVPILHRKGPDATEVENLEKERPEIDRRVLRQILLDAVPADSIKWDHALVSARQLDASTGQHELTFANGVVTVVDILVGADGAHSRILPLLSSATPTYYGLTGAEISLPPDVVALPENNDISDAVGEGSCYVFEDSKVFVFQRNGDGRIRGYAWHRDALDWALPRDPIQAKKVLLGIYEDWAPWMRKLIEIADEQAIYQRPLFYLPVGHRWEHKPGVTVIGDAAHLMGPFAGAGANIAMLDGLELGLVLADVIDQGLDVKEREAAIAAFEEGMCACAEKYAALTMRNFELAMSDDAPLSIASSFTQSVDEL
ncbi:monooxygenase FAD-binding protein [Trametes punicea]|nr:monooxygenase FAD-binding protein [Trametes punicea]